MRSTIALSVAALAGATLAAPQYGNPVEVVHWKIETAYHTVYETPAPQPTGASYGGSSPQPPAAPQYPAPSASSEKPQPPAATPPSYQAPQPASPSPAAPSSAAPSSAAPQQPSKDSGYMGVVGEWRKKLGLKELKHDAKLESNALNCVTESNGQMVHKLNPGTYGQVLAPGSADDFEHVFVGGWLCEIPTLPGLNGICSKESQGWSYEQQTGHAKILTDPSYTIIGCALYNGIWGCDLGY